MPADSGNGRIAKGGGAVGAPTLVGALADRAQGCLAGAAVGDALGGATEGRAAEAIVAHYGGHVTGVVQSMTAALGDRPLAPFHKGDGHVTDDTLLTHALVRVYEQKRDHLDAYDIERLLVPDLIGAAGVDPRARARGAARAAAVPGREVARAAPALRARRPARGRASATS